MIEILGPSNLQEGFKFMAVYDGTQFPVIVVSFNTFFIVTNLQSGMLAQNIVISLQEAVSKAKSLLFHLIQMQETVSACGKIASLLAQDMGCFILPSYVHCAALLFYWGK